ncbi:procyclin-associated gene 2-like protein, putative [Trypanosoma equiperdum]|uniref:Procyclin-associated gene 2-like protein, putative n=1 Tax=Trypanosoma equiperdum TaxID=5694 RepID=A0A1G4IBP5_TRYEQ|nr:procyclin-associated gene 2-like protein, putative [Trypanosoma equiperdum]
MRFMLRLVMLLGVPVVFADVATMNNKPLSNKTIESICDLSKMLKFGVHAYVLSKTREVEEKLKEVTIVGNYAKLKMLTGNLSGFECAQKKIYVTHTLETKRARISDLFRDMWSTGAKLVGSSGLVAGRLDELVNVFASAWSNDTYYCAQGFKKIVTCNTSKDSSVSLEDFDRKGLASIVDETLSINSDEVLENKSTSCLLTQGFNGGGYLKYSNNQDQTKSSGLKRNIVWGDGIFGIRRNGNGSASSQGIVSSAEYPTDVMWEHQPSKMIPIIKSTVKDFVDFQKGFKEIGVELRALFKELKAKGMMTTVADSDIADSDQQLLNHNFKMCGKFSVGKGDYFKGSGVVGHTTLGGNCMRAVFFVFSVVLW